MEGRRIQTEEQQCLSRCITTHWGQEAMASSASPEERDKSYEVCLKGCQICA
jgi:hypothetical protein